MCCYAWEVMWHHAMIMRVIMWQWAHTYCIFSNTRSGVYFLPVPVDPALKREQLLNRTCVYKPIHDRQVYWWCNRQHSERRMSPSIWTPFIEEELQVVVDGNEHAVTVMKDSFIVRHVPRCISRVSWFFLICGGCIFCHITGKWKLGVDHAPVRIH